LTEIGIVSIIGVREVITLLSLTLGRTSMQIDRAAQEIDRSCQLRQAFSSALAETRALLRRSRALCLAHPRIRGGSDGDLSAVTDVLNSRPLCLACIASKTGLSPSETGLALQRIRDVVAVTVEDTQCGACLEDATTYRFTQTPSRTAQGSPALAARQAALTRREAIWRFLESRRGEMFCTECVANALQAARRIDRAILAVEGRGARRQYGRCSSCGKDRLLCGLIG
jgi:hypothetical protein